MTKVNVSGTVGMSAQDRGGNVCNSGEIEYALRNVRLDFIIFMLERCVVGSVWILSLAFTHKACLGNNLSRGKLIQALLGFF